MKILFRSNARNDSSVSEGLIRGSILDIFIRNQLSVRGDINVGRPLSKLPLVDPVTLVDEFDTWHFDHLHGLFELNLLPENQIFPLRWKLAPDAKLSYRIETTEKKDQENEQKPRNVDRPSTASLEQFVEDVCEKENNGMAAKWIEALHEDDLFTYDHLANLKYIEWSELKVLSMNGKKILKSYIDREKQMAVDIKSNKDQALESTRKFYSIIDRARIGTRCARTISLLHLVRNTIPIVLENVLSERYPKKYLATSISGELESTEMLLNTL